jgi:hypothetical protein
VVSVPKFNFSRSYGTDLYQAIDNLTKVIKECTELQNWLYQLEENKLYMLDRNLVKNEEPHWRIVRFDHVSDPDFLSRHGFRMPTSVAFMVLACETMSVPVDRTIEIFLGEEYRLEPLDLDELPLYLSGYVSKELTEALKEQT